jgi:hypothetical protein
MAATIDSENWYKCWSGVSVEKAKAEFKRVYGREPMAVVIEKGVTWAGPVTLEEKCQLVLSR